MKKERIMELVKLLAIPGLLMVLGLLLLFNPDYATALVSKIIGWILVIFGAAKAISMANRHSGSVGNWILAAVCVVCGIFILKNPLWLAKGIGRFIGLLLVVEGYDDVRKAVACKNAGAPYRPALILAIVTLAAGVALILTPMSLIRTVLRLCGLVVAIVGGINIAEKLREVKLLESGGDPNIIDADE